MKSLSSSILILILFVSIYVFCISTYTFITALSTVNMWTEKNNNFDNIDNFFRAKRGAIEENRINGTLPSNSWKSNITINMCCAENEYLNSKLECVKLNFSTEFDLHEKKRLLSEVAVLDENLTKNFINLSSTIFKYNFRKNCQSEEILVLTWPPESIQRKTAYSNLSTSSYCLNKMEGREKIYVALLCPCLEQLCIQKCCQEGYYYNTIDKSCKNETEDNIKSYRPTFYKMNKTGRGDISYHLIYNFPNCSGLDTLIGSKNTSAIYVQENGSVMVHTDNAKVDDFDRKKYCVDVFSDGNDNSSYVNGFYCRNDTAPVAIVKETIKEVPEIKVVPNITEQLDAAPVVIMKEPIKEEPEIKIVPNITEQLDAAPVVIVKEPIKEEPEIKIVPNITEQLDAAPVVILKEPIKEEPEIRSVPNITEQFDPKLGYAESSDIHHVADLSFLIMTLCLLFVIM